MMNTQKRVVTLQLVRDANNAAISGKQYAKHIREAAERLPRFTAEEINSAWAKANGRSEQKTSV
ncbi:hypothetical protein [uncultured Desulfovibrio sp.]|uniref:hypothetical protein n=1 Tax=uncultured Desulfovibrio sp. TaxID=167968 RepID=UPI002631EF88|nr:hypothetical protein [uncultured Desulfovibrio sp.]